MYEKHQQEIMLLPPDKREQVLHKSGKMIWRKKRWPGGGTRLKNSTMLSNAIKRREAGSLDVHAIDPRLKTEAITEYMAGDKGLVEIAKQLGITPRRLCNVLAAAEVDKVLSWGRSEMVRRIPKAIGVYDHHLEDRNLEAARDVLTTTGVMQNKRQQEQPDAPLVNFNFAMLTPENAKELLKALDKKSDD